VKNHAEKALDYTIRLARAFSAERHIIHDVKNVEITKTIMRRTFSSKVELTADALYESLKKEASEWMTKCERKAKAAVIANVTTRILTEVGKSEVQMITEHAQRVKADLKIVGSQGLSTFKRLLLGSIVSGVVSQALPGIYGQVADSFGW